jgi:methylenetetrahydrofolate reductase (NADPH)
VYFAYVERLRQIGVKARVIPGILPITDLQGLRRFCERCGANIPDKVEKTFAPIADDPEKTLRAGIDFAVEQCRELLQGGAPGIHFYTLNKAHPVDRILEAVRA